MIRYAKQPVGFLRCISKMFKKKHKRKRIKYAHQDSPDQSAHTAFKYCQCLALAEKRVSRNNKVSRENLENAEQSLRHSCNTRNGRDKYQSALTYQNALLLS